jgi:hypothetical protein
MIFYKNFRMTNSLRNVAINTLVCLQRQNIK